VVEIEDDFGQSLNIGEWRMRRDGYVELVIPAPVQQGAGIAATSDRTSKQRGGVMVTTNWPTWCVNSVCLSLLPSGVELPKIPVQCRLMLGLNSSVKRIAPHELLKPRKPPKYKTSRGIFPSSRSS